MAKTSNNIHYHWRHGTYTYLAALALIAILAICSHYLVQGIITEQEATARIVNLAGRQRMLSQRITLFAGDIVNNKESSYKLAKEYQQSIEQMTRVHEGLINGSKQLEIPLLTSQAVRAIFFKPPVNLDQKVNNFLHLASTLTSDNINSKHQRDLFNQLKFSAYHEMLQSLDTLVLRYQQESESAIQQLQFYNRISLGGMLLTLLLEAIFIFRPLLLNLYRRERQYVTLLQQKEQEIADHVRFQVFNDYLTKLPNRLAMLERIQTCIQLVNHNRSHLVVIAISLNRFSSINESLGHENGDLLLIELAGRLNQFIGQKYYGFVGRIVADEFAMVIDLSKDSTETPLLLRQLSALIHTPISLQSPQPQDVQLSASFGLAFYPDDGQNPYELILHANQAMGIAKTEGGENFRIFSPTMTSQISRRNWIEQHLRQSLHERGKEQLQLVYQPKVNLQTYQLMGVEALLRWNHPQEGPISPAEFIPVAESSGVILELGEWVLIQAFKQIAQWQKQNLSIKVAVNVSVKQLLKENISQSIIAIANRARINPSMVQIEITEDHMMENLTQIINELTMLERFGFELAIDDFGTGHSSLARLRNLPVKYLKIDRSFVCNAPHDHKDAQLVAAIIDMGHSLNKVIIAEGIETTEQMELLQTLGCEQGQGFLFAKPLKPEELIKFIHLNHIAPTPYESQAM
ncbi:EAL domain-containing protein [Celerinatantimonas diazotrophica]|uniref:Diguanylate cyclase (GGDEF)-like protein n=1 Tax=Celerinatantimonas diazotrophica TaxID=412034 RepID=A0A4R1K271_9GAMM|nr:EAL domain-containing protein [Celerinatantimonas diazotrophica]TCK58118.1 diguanylate cyclase (GGDEF)-like protein [Celerinatantimonas diazotrophica]CAG9297810.1 hypothetical protein CEDIAZO_03001 [Celerinatantimonas diazotrophica]